MMDRRKFIKSSVLAGLGVMYGSCTLKGKVVSGKIIGQNSSAGHYFRDHKIEPATIFQPCEVAIIGGGISGLSAARALTLAGKKDILLLEMEATPGGNSKWGENDISQYPFGAHYLPIPNIAQTEILDFLATAGVIVGEQAGLPVYSEYHICQDPEERLYINNYWQEGIVPQHGLSEADQKEMERFFFRMGQLKEMKGKDGKYHFDIPISAGSADESLHYLDTYPMDAWLKQEGFSSAYLTAYLNYAMKDDFGTLITDISAWVAIHYFASRRGQAANAKHADVLTWPGGNGFLAQQLLKQSRFTSRTNAMVYAVEERADAVYISYFDTLTQKSFGIAAKAVVAAIPAFIFQRILGNHHLAQIPYAPWMVANLKVKNELIERRGMKMSWDNVIFNSEGLGYINNNHQLLNQAHPYLNLTYYRPFAKGALQDNRKRVLDTTYEEWVKAIVSELQLIHPNIEDCLLAADIQLWGHAMVQPRVGWIFGHHRAALLATGSQRVQLAHTDYAGISIFEEAFYQGWNAAQNIINA